MTESEAIIARHSVRQYLDKPIEAEKIAQLSALIEEITIREIKRLLRQNDLSIKEICTQMRFVSLSFFCKYVKTHLGMTASEYRRKIRHASV